jgi:hypothetical protein
MARRARRLHLGPQTITLALFGVEIIILLVFALLLLSHAPVPRDFQKNSTPAHLARYFRRPFRTSNVSKLASEQIKRSISKYIDACLGSDYLRPISNTCLQKSGLSLTLIDSLDTLFIIQSADQFERLRDFVQNLFTCKQNHFLPLHELSTNVIGGLLSAYSLTGDDLFLEKAIECGDVAMAAFRSGPVPKPLVHGTEGTSRSYSWSDGTTLTAASSFLSEFHSLSRLSGRRKYSRRIKPFLKCIQSHPPLLPLFLGPGCQNTTAHFGLSPLNVGLLANLLRLEILRPKAVTGALIDSILRELGDKSLKTSMQVTNSTVARFDSSFCQLLPLLEFLQPPQKRLYAKVLEKCQVLADQALPVVSAVMGKNYLDFDDDGFDFDASLIEFALVRGGSFRELAFVKFAHAAECSGAVCGVHSQSEGVYRDFMPPAEISRWLKLLYLDGLELRDAGFVLNEAGHTM